MILMATARKLPSGSWRCQIYSHTEEYVQEDGTIKKKRIYKSFTSNLPGTKGKRDAERQAAEWAAGKESVSKCNFTYSEALERYIEARSSVLSPSTIREYKRSRKSDLQGLMDKMLSEITQEDVQLEINKESLTHSPKSVRNMHGLLSAVFATYRPEFTLRTALPKKKPPTLYIPDEDDIKKLISYVKDTEMEIPVLLAAFGPMRRGEIAALCSDHIAGDVVHVEYALALDANGKWGRKSTKTEKGDRYIEFPHFVIEKMSGISGQITHLTPGQISDRFVTIIKKSGLPKFRFHDLRHYSASIQHALGIPDAYIMQRGGWKSDTVLKNVYRHALDDSTKKMNTVANDYFNSLCNTKCNTKNKNP